MFYETHGLTREKLNAIGLAFNPFKAIVAPRPIGWVTTVDGQGAVNLAPYSFFNAVASDPPMVFFGVGGVHEAGGGGPKDSLRNVRETGEFVCNLVTWDLRHQMSDSSAAAPPGVSEAEAAGIALLPSTLVKPPRVAASPAQLECKLHQLIDLPDDPVTGRHNVMVLGRVVGVHIDERFVVGGRFDTARARPVARCGYNDYAVFSECFEILRPKWPLGKQQ
jgi:flavin reductase (DIM6/NTAB) family NADH-FMN oxidoreductase RutF